MPKIKMPKFGFKGPKVEGPDVDVKIPKTDIDINAPNVDIKAPELDIEGPEGKVKGPKFKMPSLSGPTISMPDVDFNLKGPKLKGDVDVSVPKVEGDIKARHVDIKTPQVDIEGPEGKFKGPKFSMPSISGPNISMPDVGFNLKGPKLKGDVDVSVPKVEGEIKAPNVELEGPDIEGPEGGFKMPKIKMPKFGFKGPKVEGPDVDVKIPKTDIDIKAPEVDIKAPELDIEGPEGKIKGPKLKIPSFSGPTISMPDVDFNLKGPKLEGDVDVSVPKVKGDIKAPDVNIKPPYVDIEGPEGKLKGPKFHMPSISGPNISMPDVDFNLKGPKLKGDVDISVPKVKGDIKVPKVDIEGPDFDVEGPEGGFKMPKLPTFGLKGPKLEGPEIDVKIPKTNIDVKAPDVDIEAPDLNVEGPGGKMKSSKFKMPSVSVPKVSMPDVDFNLKGSKLKGDVDVSVPKMEGDIKGAKVKIEGPGYESPEGGFKIPKMPSFGLKGPKVEGPDIDINLPKAGVDIKGPELEVKTPDLEIEGHRGKIKGPNFKMPSLSGPQISMPDINIKGPKVKGDMGVPGPKIGGDLKSAEVDIKGPSIDARSPDVTISGPNANIKVPKTKKSKFSFGVKSPKLDADIPDAGGNLEGPDINIDVKGKKGKFKLPKGKGKSKTFDADLKTEMVELETNEPEIHLKSTKVKKPLFGKLHFPDVEFDIKSPKVKASSFASGTIKSSDVDLPSASLKTDVQTPDASLDSPDLKTKGGKIKMPKFSMPASKLKTPDLDVRDATLEIPEKTIHSPDVSVAGSGINGKRSAEIDIEGKVQGAELTVPSANVHGEALDADLGIAEQKGVKGSIGIAGFNVGRQKGDTASGLGLKSDASLSGEMENQEGNLTFPKIKVPKFGVALPRVEPREMGVDVGSGELAAGAKVSSQGLEMQKTDVKSSGGKVKVKMPKLFVKSKSKGGSAADLTVEGEDANATTKGDAKVSKELSLSSGELTSGKLSLDGSSGFKVSPKSKSASLDFFKKSRHHSSSVSEEGGLASPVSTEGHLQAEGGNISLDVGDTKVKGKKGKLKFSTIGGFSSKSKGSYEVTDESEVMTEGAGGVAQPLKKSRMSSSSSSDSGTKSFRLPQLEISVSPKK